MLAAVLMLVAGSADQDAQAMIARAAQRLRVGECGAQPCAAPRKPSYRLTGYSGDQGPDAKGRAFANDGSYCDVVGDRICPAGRHAILRSGETPGETIAGNLPR